MSRMTRRLEKPERRIEDVEKNLNNTPPNTNSSMDKQQVADKAKSFFSTYSPSSANKQNKPSKEQSPTESNKSENSDEHIDLSEQEKHETHTNTDDTFHQINNVAQADIAGSSIEELTEHIGNQRKLIVNLKRKIKDCTPQEKRKYENALKRTRIELAHSENELITQQTQTTSKKLDAVISQYKDNISNSILSPDSVTDNIEQIQAFKGLIGLMQDYSDANVNYATVKNSLEQSDAPSAEQKRLRYQSASSKQNCEMALKRHYYAYKKGIYSPEEINKISDDEVLDFEQQNPSEKMIPNLDDIDRETSDIEEEATLTSQTYDVGDYVTNLYKKMQEHSQEELLAEEQEELAKLTSIPAFKDLGDVLFQKYKTDIKNLDTLTSAGISIEDIAALAREGKTWDEINQALGERASSLSQQTNDNSAKDNSLNLKNLSDIAKEEDVALNRDDAARAINELVQTREQQQNMNNMQK